VTTVLQAFPFPSTLGEVTLHPLSQVGMFILQLMWEGGLPTSPVEFSSHGHFYKLSGSWWLGVWRWSCLLLQACLFTVPWGISPPLLWCLGHPTLLAMCLFCCCLLFSFSFFPGWGWICPGGYADLAQGVPGVCGSTTCHLAHLVVCFFPNHLGAGVW
jgi:hypothetical protein